MYRALKSMATGKFGGQSQIVPDLLKYSTSALNDCLEDLLWDV